MLEEIAILESFGCQIEHLTFAVADAPSHFAGLGPGEMRVHGKGIDTDGCQLILLVLHQRDERADDDGESGEQQRWELVDERLAAAGRHDDERIFSGENSSDRFPLAILEFSMAEALSEYAESAALRSLLRHGTRKGTN